MVLATGLPPMIPDRNSLRFRMLLAFVLLGVLLGPALAGVLVFVSHELEERAVARVLEQRLARVVSRPGEYRLQEAPGPDTLHVHGSVPLAELPPAVFALGDGVHEYEHGDREWFIALSTASDGTRYATVEDTTALDQRKYVSRLTLAGGVLFAVIIAVWAGFRISGRILQPVAALAGAVPQGRRRFQDVVPHDDEVGSLARALDVYRGRMEEAWRREHEFASDASHELRTPLTIIQNAAELIEVDSGLSARARRATRRVLDASRSMQETVTGLLLLTRESTPAEGYEPVAIAPCLLSIVEACRAATGAEIELAVEDRPAVTAPRVAVEVVVGNLVRNAVQHGWGRPVGVVLCADRLVVTDHGAGIPPDELTAVTGRGQRASNASGDGAGLGLSLASRLCERFGWRLEFTSVVGEGTSVQWIFRRGESSGGMRFGQSD